MPAVIRHLGLCDYATTWQAMRAFTEARDIDTADEFWLLEHPSVFTLGQNGKTEHLLHPGDIPVINIDRGGQVTYHGPGQLIVYTLVDIERKRLTIRDLVTALEQAIIGCLEDYQLEPEAKREAPGVYLTGQKIASIGLRIRKGKAYHGLALNVAMDLEPFSRINPCGYPGLQMTDLQAWVTPAPSIEEVSNHLLQHLMRHLG